jgi:hypothetical protein
MKKSAKKTGGIESLSACEVMTISDGCFEAQADFSEFPWPGISGIMNEDGIIINECDEKFKDLVINEIGYF